MTVPPAAPIETTRLVLVPLRVEDAEEMADVLHVCVPFAPDSNIVCMALNPVGNRDVAAMNGFIRGLHAQLSCDPGQPVQARDFYASMTTLRPDALGAEDTARVLGALDLDADSLRPEHEGADRLFILRHTLMNPFLNDGENGISYIDGYFDHLGRQVREKYGSRCALDLALRPLDLGQGAAADPDARCRQSETLT